MDISAAFNSNAFSNGERSTNVSGWREEIVGEGRGRERGERGERGGEEREWRREWGKSERRNRKEPGGQKMGRKRV
eukprot:572925-Amorphochlora_amoeboformis.AAC.1